ncbi:MAG: hypothetical protein KA419_10540 [Acidobacteria bacterium]|nr:hypothetical protein [Acidobacteriota bacterium]
MVIRPFTTTGSGSTAGGFVRRTLVVGLLFALASLAAAGPPAEQGLPWIQNFSPREYRAQPQNWAFVQDRRGVVYAGNNDGVLEYDGVRWRLIPTANRTCVRSLDLDGEGRIWVGAQGEFGYLRPDAGGALVFVSLADRLKPQHRTFNDVWCTHATRAGVFFTTRNRLFRYSGGRVRSWAPTTSFHQSYRVGERLFLREPGRGLVELNGDALRPLPGGERFAGEKIGCMLPWPAAVPGGPDRILVGTRGQGLLLLDGGGLAEFPTQADDFLRQNLLYHGLVLPDGSVALATVHGGVVHLDHEGRLIRVVDKRSGLQDETVYALFLDGQSGLWLGLENGISRVAMSEPLSRYDERSGLKGTVMTVCRHAGVLHVGTSRGIHRLESVLRADNGLPAPAFLPVTGIRSQIWAFLPVGTSLLVADNEGVHEIRGSQATMVRPSVGNTGCLCPSRVNPSRIFVGMQDGLASIRRSDVDGGPWVDEGRVPGITEQVRSIAEDDDGRLWLGTRNHGVLRLTFPGGGRKAARPVPAIERYGLSHGLPSPNENRVDRAAGGILFCTHAGIYRFDTPRGRFLPDPRFARLFGGEARRVSLLREDARGDLWLHTMIETQGAHGTGVALRQADGTFRFVDTPFLRLAEYAIDAICPEPDGVVWLGGTDGLLRYDPRVPKDYARDFATLVRRVSVNGRGLFGGAGAPPGEGGAEGPRLEPADHSLAFEFAATSFDAPSALRYQVRLEGYDPDWSPWGPAPFKEYTNLPPGDYRFRVRAKNVHGHVGREGDYPFRILPPWTETWWARALALAGLVALGYGGFRWGVASLERRHQRELSRQKAETEAQRLRSAWLEQVNRMKNDFLTTTSHELRTPLTSIVGYANLTRKKLQEVLLNPDVTDEFRRQKATRQVMGNMEVLLEESRRLEKLIEKILDLSTLESGLVDWKTEPVDLHGLIVEVIAAHGRAAGAKGLTLRQDLCADPAALFGDGKRLRQVIDNLVGNAVKFTPTGGAVSIRLEWGVPDDEGQPPDARRAGADRLPAVGEGPGPAASPPAAPRFARVSVVDTGPGLDDDEWDTVFDVFHPAGDTLAPKPEGAGLGLPICRKIVEHHGGRIWAEPNPGGGCVFRFTLPTDSSV